MGFRGISAPSVIINGEIIEIIPETLGINLGLAEKMVQSVSLGNGKYTTMHTLDGTTAVGKMKFDLPVKPGRLEDIINWSNQTGQNFIELIEEQDDGTSSTILFESASLKTDPPIDLSSKSKATLEWEGDPLIL